MNRFILAMTLVFAAFAVHAAPTPIIKRAGKPHELLLIKHAGHQLRWRSDRLALWESIEKFLGKHL